MRTKSLLELRVVRYMRLNQIEPLTAVMKAANLDFQAII